MCPRPRPRRRRWCERAAESNDDGLTEAWNNFIRLADDGLRNGLPRSKASRPHQSSIIKTRSLI